LCGSALIVFAMKKLMLPINVVLEYLTRKVEWFMHRKQKPSLVAMGLIEFTNESWLDGVVRQGRLMEQLYYGSNNN
jgi:hypothetical protein